MLAKDIQVVDLGSENLARFFQLACDALSKKAGSEASGPLFVIYRGLKALKAIDLAAMRPVDVDFHGTSRLDALSSESGYPRVLALQENALARVIGHAQREVRYDDDYFKQWNAFLKGFRREWNKTIFTYPPGPARLPAIPYAFFERAFRALIPDGSITLFAVTENGAAWASIVIGYRNGDFWLLSSLDTIGKEEADLRDEALETALESIRSKYGGKVRAITIERESLSRILSSRFKVGSLLWAFNTGELRLENIPLRWKLLTLLLALTSTRTRK